MSLLAAVGPFSWWQPRGGSAKPPVELAQLRLNSTLAQLRGAVPKSHGYRAADSRLAAELGAQSIPRTIVQTGRDFEHAKVRHREWMRTWWQLNPEYEYKFFSDPLATRFVNAKGTADEICSYSVLLVGAQRADLFRMLYLKYKGGVYADLDMELRQPLREIIPRDASGLAGKYWPFEFLIFEPGHPVIVEAAARAVSRILLEASRGSCKGAQKCILDVTGPVVYTNGVWAAATVAGCRSKLQRVEFYTGSCSQVAADHPFARTHQCSEPGAIGSDGLPTWDCGAMRHWDCRRSRGITCGREHYSESTQDYRQPAGRAPAASEAAAVDALRKTRVPLSHRAGAFFNRSAECARERGAVHATLLMARLNERVDRALGRRAPSLPRARVPSPANRFRIINPI